MGTSSLFMSIRPSFTRWCQRGLSFALSLRLGGVVVVQSVFAATLYAAAGQNAANGLVANIIPGDKTWDKAGVLTDVSAATTNLKNVQRTGFDKGWATSPELSSDSITIAEVTIALTPCQLTDSSLVTPIAKGLA